MLYLCISRMEKAAPIRAFSILFGASEGIFFLISGSTKCRVSFSKCRIDFFRKHLRKIIRHLVKTTKPADCKQRLFMLKVNRRRVPFPGPRAARPPLPPHVTRPVYRRRAGLRGARAGYALPHRTHPRPARRQDARPGDLARLLRRGPPAGNGRLRHGGLARLPRQRLLLYIVPGRRHRGVAGVPACPAVGRTPCFFACNPWMCGIIS